MSYARWSEDSDVYVYPGDEFVCYAIVQEGDPDRLYTRDAAEMLRFLKQLRDKGYAVPDHAFIGIFKDRNLYRDYDGDYDEMMEEDGREPWPSL